MKELVQNSVVVVKLYKDETKKLSLILIFLILVVSVILGVVPLGKENRSEILIISTKTGFETKTFVVESKAIEQPFADREYPKRYTEKIWDYYDKSQEARDRTFFR